MIGDLMTAGGSGPTPLRRPMDRPVDRLLREHLTAVAQGKAERWLAGTSRWRWVDRRYRRENLAAAVKSHARCQSEVRDSDVRDAAFDLVARLWRGHAERLMPRTSRWHPRLEARRRALSGRMAQDALAQTVRSIIAGTKAGDIPALAAALTETAVRAMLDEHAAKINAAAADPRIETASGTSGKEHRPVCVIEHPATGIRARFHLPYPGSEFGSVHSKPYEIAPIAADFRQSWELYAGLGVGTRIYRYAAGLHPEVRWAVYSTSEYSAGVRQHVHRADPYRWQAQSCDWCRAHNLGDSRQWRAASPADFVGHPQ